jgi:hypothetical protein
VRLHSAKAALTAKTFARRLCTLPFILQETGTNRLLPQVASISSRRSVASLNERVSVLTPILRSSFAAYAFGAHLQVRRSSSSFQKASSHSSATPSPHSASSSCTPTSWYCMAGVGLKFFACSMISPKSLAHSECCLRRQLTGRACCKPVPRLLRYE